MAENKVVYRLPEGKKVEYAGNESWLRLLLTTFWHYPFWLALTLSKKRKGKL